MVQGIQKAAEWDLVHISSTCKSVRVEDEVSIFSAGLVASLWGLRGVEDGGCGSKTCSVKTQVCYKQMYMQDIKLQ